MGHISLLSYHVNKKLFFYPSEEERENPDEVRKMQKDSDLLKDMISNVDEENNNLINEFKKFQIQHENEDDSYAAARCHLVYDGG